MKTTLFLTTALISLGAWAQSDPVTNQPVAMGMCAGIAGEDRITVTCPISQTQPLTYVVSKATFKNADAAASFCKTNAEASSLDDGSLPFIAYFMLAPSQELAEALNKSVIEIRGEGTFVMWKNTLPAASVVLSVPGLPAILDHLTPLDENIGNSLYDTNKNILISGSSFEMTPSNMAALKNRGLLEEMSELPAICANMSMAQIREVSKGQN